MRFDEFIVVDSINPNLQATTKEDAIREMKEAVTEVVTPKDGYDGTSI